jgi:3-oxoacyl-[acyl-carrier-protein] synthase I
MKSPTSVSIVGFGACTSLGYSLESTLAAMGAGLTNFAEMSVPDELGQPTVGGWLIDPELPRARRLAALLQLGLEDLDRLLPRGRVAELPVFVGVASDLTTEEKDGVRRAAREQQLPASTKWYPYGRASTFAAMAAARDVVLQGSHPLALVAGIDSLCAPETVAALVAAGRVIGPFTEGTIPGEAAAFALLGRADDPVVDAATVVDLESVAVTRGQVPFSEAQMVTADGLTAAFRTFREQGTSRVHRIVAAHSGEGYFGRSFAHAYLREVEIMPEPLTVELTADRVGDVGAAAGVLGLAFCAYWMADDRRPGRSRALTYSESDTGEIGAAILDGAPLAWQRSSVRN